MNSQWYALYTRGRHEKFIDGELCRRKIDCFAPTRKIKRRWSDRTVVVEEPLFKSYVFVHTDLEHISDVLRTKGAVKFVSSQGRPITVDERVIASLKTLVSQELALDPFPYLAVGDKITVTGGIFKGIEGYVLRKDQSKCRLVISIAAIMASISVEIDSCLVEKI